MLSLYFNPQKFPRTITRAEWKEIWRWKRVTEQRLVVERQKQLDMLDLFGTTHPELFDHIINPPLLIHDKQKL